MARLPSIPRLLVAGLCAVTAATAGAQDKLAADVTVNVDQRYQTIDSFGFSEAFQRAGQMRGKFTFGNLRLSPADQRRVLDLLFSPETGAGATILRNAIGSATSIAPVSPGSPAAPPRYEWDRSDDDQVWLTREGLKYGALKYVYADAWSAPAYMKSNGNDTNGGHLCGSGGGDGSSAACAAIGDWRQAYADYLVQYLRFYREREGIKITHLGWLNEPDLNQTYASMLSDGFEAGDFAPLLRRTLDAAELGHVRIICCEATGWTQGAAMLAELKMVAGAEEALDVYSAHGYSAPPGRPLPTTRKVWQTEWTDLNGAWNPAWESLGKEGEGLPWANRIQEALVFGNVSAWLWWFGAEETPYNSAMIQLQNNSISVSGRLWAFAQFSRFVKPGAVRVEAASSLAFVGTSAFLNEDGHLAVQLINNGHRDLDVRLNTTGLKRGQDRPYMWLTNNEHNLTRMDLDAGPPSANPGPLAGLLPSRSMATFII